MHSSGVCCIGVCGVFLLLFCLHSGAVPDAAATSLLTNTTLKSSLGVASLRGAADREERLQLRGVSLHTALIYFGI
jgi:hypothetical protein